MRIITNKKGFTLIELILSVAIIGILAMVIAQALFTGVSSFDIVSKRKALLSDIRLAIDRMSYEITLIPDTNNIVSFSSSSLTFNIPSENNITYTLNSSNITRSSAVIAGNVSSLTFTYLDAAGASTAVKANIKRIGIEISASAGSSYGTLNVKTQAFPRRLATRYAGYQ